MSVNLTEKAALRVQDYLARHGQAVGLRIGVRRTGCSGWAYTVDYAEQVGPGDEVLESRGVRVIVAADAVALLQGTTIDFVREGLNERFAFENPNATSQCGCGESFSVQ
jgi:iron-sulfur cluster assembly protein